jgi:hypothetical protein
MNTKDEFEMSETESGNVWVPGFIAHQAFLTRAENNPRDYTWMMDWYYEE